MVSDETLQQIEWFEYWRLAKRAYITFWIDFHFLQDQAKFWQTDLFFDSFFLICTLFSRNNTCKKNWKTKETFRKETLCFITVHIITLCLISYCCFVSASEGAEWARFELLLLWDQFNMKSANFLFPVRFSNSFKNQNIYLRKTSGVKAARSNRSH